MRRKNLNQIVKLDDAQYWFRQQMENLSADYYLLYRDTR